MDPGNNLHIVHFRVQVGITVYDHLVLIPILSQMIDSFAEITDLVGFIVWFV